MTARPSRESSSGELLSLEALRRNRAERLIAAGRILLALFCLIAFLLDPPDRELHPPAALAVTLANFAYAGAALLFALLSRRPWSALAVTTQILDLLVFTSLIYFTSSGLVTPFFVGLLFPIVTATMRWDARGTAWAAAAALVAFSSVGWAAAAFGDFPLNEFLVRSAGLAVVAALLGYLGSHQAKLRRDLSRIAAWSAPERAETSLALRDLLGQVAEVLGSPRVLLIWETSEEPWVYAALWKEGEIQLTREPPGAFTPLTAPELAGAAFFCRDARGGAPSLLHAPPGGFTLWRGQPIPPALLERFDISAVLSLPIAAGDVEARLCALDRRRLTSDDLVIGEIVAERVVRYFEQLDLLEQIRRTGASEERVRLARDLHDGLLQSLTGAALQLQAARTLLPARTDAADQTLGELQQMVETHQRELRQFIWATTRTEPLPAASLVGRLEELRSQVGRQWGLPVELSVAPGAISIPDAQAQDVYLLVREAIVNAARHSGASQVRAHLALDNGSLRIEVADDGRGFPFTGRYDFEDLLRQGIGPESLKERVAKLGGRMAIESSETGARLEIVVPVRAAG
jgi:signal transduction histidine kinase